MCRMRTLHLAVLLPMLAACAGPRVTGSPEPDRQQARRMLADMAGTGPVPLVILGDPSPLAKADLPALAARGIVGLKPGFALADAAASERLVLWFDPPSGVDGRSACAGAEAVSTPAGAPRLLAAWCEGAQPVAEVAGITADGSGAAAGRLVWQATQRLFPDDYADRYGFSVLGWRIRLGGSASF